MQALHRILDAMGFLKDPPGVGVPQAAWKKVPAEGKKLLAGPPWGFGELAPGPGGYAKKKPSKTQSSRVGMSLAKIWR